MLLESNHVPIKLNQNWNQFLYKNESLKVKSSENLSNQMQVQLNWNEIRVEMLVFCCCVMRLWSWIWPLFKQQKGSDLGGMPCGSSRDCSTASYSYFLISCYFLNKLFFFISRSSLSLLPSSFFCCCCWCCRLSLSHSCLSVSKSFLPPPHP